MPNDNLVSEIKIDRQTLFTDDQTRKINRGVGEFSVSSNDKKVEPVKIQHATRIAREAYKPFYQKSESVVGYGLIDVFLTPDQTYEFRPGESETMRVAGDKPMAELIFVDPTQLLLQKMEDKDKKIKELTAKLNEFERVSWFEFDGLDLPDDYYQNDAYSDR